VTDCWVEACCYHQRILSPDDKLVFRPLSIEAPLQGADALNVHISGFSAEIRSFLRRIIRTVGGTISDKFSRHTTHLVCAESGGLKFERARMWKIPAVRESWIWGMAESGAFDNVAEHLHDERE
jgi:DNA replication regulator DPB11